jgi:hypothetical protein
LIIADAPDLTRDDAAPVLGDEAIDDHALGGAKPSVRGLIGLSQIHRDAAVTCILFPATHWTCPSILTRSCAWSEVTASIRRTAKTSTAAADPRRAMSAR